MQGYLSILNLDFVAGRNLDPNPIVVFALVPVDVINEVVSATLSISDCSNLARRGLGLR